MQDVFTTGQVAKICHVAPRTVSKWFDSGMLKGYNIPGSKDRRIPRAPLIEFMKKHDIPLDGLRASKVTRVLVVDGDSDTVDVLKTVLQGDTLEVRSEATPFFAGMEVETFRPDVIIIDVELFSGDPRGFGDLLKRRPGLELTKLIATSKTMTDEAGKLMLAYGFDHFVRKPLATRMLSEAIQHVLEN